MFLIFIFMMIPKYDQINYRINRDLVDIIAQP